MTKTYRTTALAGLHVAGRRLNFTIDKDTGQPQSIPGQEITLTDEEAKYELQNGVIELIDQPSPPTRRAAKAE